MIGRGADAKEIIRLIREQEIMRRRESESIMKHQMAANITGKSYRPDPYTASVTELTNELLSYFPNLPENSIIVIAARTKSNKLVFYNSHQQTFMAEINQATSFKKKQNLLSALAFISNRDNNWYADDNEAVNAYTIDLYSYIPEITNLNIKDSALMEEVRSIVLKNMPLVAAKAIGAERLLVMEKLNGNDEGKYD